MNEMKKRPPPWPYPGSPPGVMYPLDGDLYSFKSIEITVAGQDFKAFKSIDHAPASK